MFLDKLTTRTLLVAPGIVKLSVTYSLSWSWYAGRNIPTSTRHARLPHEGTIKPFAGRTAGNLGHRLAIQPECVCSALHKHS